MKTFTMTAKEYTPAVIMDADKGLIEIAGKSFPEDAIRFYKPIFKWIDEYLNCPKEKTELNLKFTYYNTSSAKKILELIKKVVSIQKTGNKVEVAWYYDEGDEDMLNAGTDYSSVVELAFKFIEVKGSL
jgi:hypothetical protein